MVGLTTVKCSPLEVGCPDQATFLSAFYNQEKRHLG